jgi:hypothetical protein
MDLREAALGPGMRCQAAGGWVRQGVRPARRATAKEGNVMARDGSGRDTGAAREPQGYRGVLPCWLEAYLELEAAACLIRTYQARFVPGLLQTADYARALIRRGPAAGEQQITRLAEQRIRRQDILRGPRPPRLWAVLDEGALRRPAVGRDTARAQLRYLIEMTGHPAVTLQIRPAAAGPHPAAGGPFTILRFAGPGLPDLTCIEQPASALYLTRPAGLDHYRQVMEQLCLHAAPAASTATILRGILAGT